MTCLAPGADNPRYATASMCIYFFPKKRLAVAWGCHRPGSRLRFQYEVGEERMRPGVKGDVLC